MTTEEQIKEIVNWLNTDYSFIESKSEVIRYNEHIAISPWACGAIICIYDQLHFIAEDDGSWFDRDEPSFSIGWIESYTEALTKLKKYVWENGSPIYYSGTSIICHYTL